MNIVYDQRLKEHMARRGMSNIVVDAINPIGCCADTSELLVRLAGDEEVARLATDPTVRVLQGDLGQVVVLKRSIELDDELQFGLRNFLGIRDISVKGAYPWRL